MALDLESVRLFVLAAEYGNLTRAAEAAGTVQPVVSQRIKSLEAALGKRLLDRGPRHVRLTEAGTAFIDPARRLLAAHEAALRWDDDQPPALALGISDHALGTAFEGLLRRLQSTLPARTPITVRLGQSGDIRHLYEGGSIDLAIIRREANTGEGEVLGEDPLAWHAPEGWAMPDGPIPVISLPPPCGVRAVAAKALDRAGLPWREAFVGGSCLALAAAVRAGLGVAPLGRMVGGDLPAANVAWGLPALPASQIVMLARTATPAQAIAARALAASVRETLKHPATAAKPRRKFNTR
ncbi:LysR family transcriptional regulator [Jiella pacifica]|uniref:LysR family transcriptional regulator n=1 Tax=Jiella pacifica TaxID=2696469 RepID=A0A6N9T1H8_9HYPH|nr:LysR family transcriptional regulator [Jiella pacifica]NDW05021.1 LysR family transcriptional regulator [Jiella pacifica]